VGVEPALCRQSGKSLVSNVKTVADIYRLCTLANEGADEIYESLIGDLTVVQGEIEILADEWRRS
jgi:hypothetical protein